MKVVVIGAGAVGTCVAYQLACGGASVVLVSADHPQRTLSVHSFAWVNAIDNGSDPYFALSVAALASHERLAEEVSGPQWFFRTGNLHWANSAVGADGLLAAAGSYRAKGYPASTWSAEDVVRKLEPGLRLDSVVGPIVFYPQDAHLYPDLFLAGVQDACRRLGVRVIVDDRVVDLDAGGARVASGERLDADAVVCCAGRGTGELLDRVGARVPLIEPDHPEVTTRGLLVRTSPRTGWPLVNRVVHAPGLSIRPHSGNRLVLHSQDLHDTRPDQTDAAVATMLRRLTDVVPAAAGVTVESAYVGIRPMPRDGLSIVGRVPGFDSLHVVVTHSGLTLAPVLGEIAAQDLLGGAHPLADAFRPDRATLG